VIIDKIPAFSMSKNNIYFPVTFYEVILDCPSVIAAILAGQLCRPLGILSII
jgi:hypothetical protein